MKTVLCFALIFVFAAAFPADENKIQPEVVRSEFNNNGDKGYNFEHETSDGSKRQETGDFRYVGGLAVRGSYEFVDEEGKTHRVEYTADERGFRPVIVDRRR